MSDDILKTLIIVGAILFLASGAGIFAYLMAWRAEAGVNALERSAREIEAKKMADKYLADKAQLTGKTQ